MLPNRVLIDNGGLPRKLEAGDGFIGMPTSTPVTTAGAGTLTTATLLSGLILRSGPTAAFIDTTDTGANLDADFPGLVNGESIIVLYCNDTGFIATIAAGVGVTMVTSAANNNVAINSSKFLKFEKAGVATYNCYVL